MATLNAATNNMKKGKTVTRKAWKTGTTVKLVKEEIVRTRPNGTTAAARFNSEDVLATDYTVVKD